MIKTLVALGANLSFDDLSPQDVLRSALNEFPVNGLKINAVSRFYRSPAFPAGSGPDYVNAAVVVESDPACDLRSLLQILHKIEANFGRKREKRWSERTLDLDLLAVDDSVFPDLAGYEYWMKLPLGQQKQQAPQDLILPHPRLQDRAFVLVPLAEIAPDWRHPVLGKTVVEMRDDLPKVDLEALEPL